MKVNGKYYEFIEDTFQKEDFAVLQGGKRAGKTTAILQYIYIKMASKRKQRAIIVTDTYARLRDSLLADLDEIRAENPKLSRIAWSGCPRLDFWNKSYITFVPSDRDTRGYKSDKNFIFFNECIQYDEHVVRDILKAGADDCKVFFDYNPYVRFYVNDKYETVTNKLITTYKDNPFCPRFAYDELERQAEVGRLAAPGTMERYVYEVECLGLNADLAGLCFPNVRIIEDDEYFDSPLPEVLGADWGQVLSTADPDVICGFKFSENRVLCHEHYYRNDGSDTDIAEVLKSIKFKRQFFVYETATAGEARVKNIYNACGLKFRFVPCSKGVGSVMIGIRNLQPFEICITRSSLNFIRESQNYKYITRKGVMQPADRYNHAFDTLRYAFDFWCNNRTKVGG